MPMLLITGANRGLGLEFAKQYSQDGWDVIATARQASPELEALGVKTEQLDMQNLDSVVAFGSRVDRLDLLIANAGTMEPARAETADDGRAWAEMMVTNTIAPFLLARSVLRQVGVASGKLIAISSRMGSITESSGGQVPYRSSKAALNMAWNALAREARPLGVAAAVLNPGWVKTRMGGAGAPLQAVDSVAQMRRVIEELTLEGSGRFLDRDGSEIPW
jgi:NAD(P)-dependent dehydrogenase (short-subunit alcohol dehydrogenase family)